MTIQDQVLAGRVNGILLPLSSMKTEKDWGVGDFSSLMEWTDFLAAQGAKILQILPLQETAPMETCPYSALSAFATDPVYADISAVEDVWDSEDGRAYVESLKNDIAFWHNAD